MRRTPLFRLLASALAFWLPLVIGEPGLLQPCPMHGMGVAISGAMHGHMDAHASMHTEHQTHTPTHQHAHCTCIGCCCAPATASLIDTPPACPVAVVTEQVAAASFPTAPQLARPAPEFSLPRTTGPPLI